MLILGKFRIGDKINFQLMVDNYQKNNFVDVEILAIIPAKMCAKFGCDIEAEFRKIYPQLKERAPGTSNSIQDDQYLVVKTQQGSEVVVGLRWINETSITMSRNVSLMIQIEPVPSEKKRVIEEQLVALGINNFTIKEL